MAQKIRTEFQIRTLPEIEGHFVELKNTPEPKGVTEQSFLVGGPIGKETAKAIDKLISYVFQRFDQEEVLRKSADGIKAIKADGTETNLGAFSPDKVASNFSRLIKGSHAGRTFVFSSIDNPAGEQTQESNQPSKGQIAAATRSILNL